MIVKGKKEFLKKLCSNVKKRMLSTFLVVYTWFLQVLVKIGILGKV